MLLDVQNIHAFYGQSHILQGISLCVAEGEIVALLGPNGMGKTTTLRSILGLTPAKSGSIIFRGEEIRHCRPFEIARKGVGYVPEDRGIFKSLTVMQNLRLPHLNKRRRAEWANDLEQVLILFPALRERMDQMGGSLSGGEQQMLATARGLIASDHLLLLDEPTEGLAPTVVQDLVEALRRIKTQKFTVLLVEQNVSTALEIADRCYILEQGRIKSEGTIEEIKKNPEILHQYLGVPYEDPAPNATP
jgi:branched-chain amino acid transport system ATP-binding protein